MMSCGQCGQPPSACLPTLPTALRRRGGYLFDDQMGTFSVVKVQAEQLKWVLFRLSNGYFFD
jgi:hypothetical protein